MILEVFLVLFVFRFILWSDRFFRRGILCSFAVNVLIFLVLMLLLFLRFKLISLCV